MKRICIFGDSITWGYDDIEKGGWVDRLKSDLQKDLIAQVFNLGISGDNSEDLAKRFKQECESRNPDIIIIAIGINDSQCFGLSKNNRININDFKKNIQKVVEDGKIFTDEIIFIGLNKVDESKTIPWKIKENKYYENKAIKRYDDEIKKLCSENNLQYIEIVDLVTKDNLSDGLHPNAEGHQLIYNQVKKYLQENSIC